MTPPTMVAIATAILCSIHHHLLCSVSSWLMCIWCWNYKYLRILFLIVIARAFYSRKKSVWCCVEQSNRRISAARFDWLREIFKRLSIIYRELLFGMELSGKSRNASWKSIVFFHLCVILVVITQQWSQRILSVNSEWKHTHFVASISLAHCKTRKLAT